MAHETLIKTTCASFFNVDPSDVSLESRLMGGMSNYTYIIKVKDDKYTFRIPGKNAEKFVDRAVEKYHIALIEPLGLNNETLYLDLKSGLKIARYIEGQPMHELDAFDYLEKATVALKKVHDSGLKSIYDYAPFERLSQYESYVEDYGHTHVERYHDYKKQLLDHKPFLDTFDKTLTHGDAQISNFVVRNGDLRLMDWEFTGMNDPYYDIACFGNVNFDHAEALLPVYLGKEPTKDNWNRLYLWRTFQCLQWHNVALYKHFIGLSEALSIDFRKVADMYLNKAQALLNKLK